MTSVVVPSGPDVADRHIIDHAREGDLAITADRSSGVETGGPKPFSQKDKQDFANALDRLLTRHAQEPG